MSPALCEQASTATTATAIGFPTSHEIEPKPRERPIEFKPELTTEGGGAIILQEKTAEDQAFFDRWSILHKKLPVTIPLTYWAQSLVMTAKAKRSVWINYGDSISTLLGYVRAVANQIAEQHKSIINPVAATSNVLPDISLPVVQIRNPFTDPTPFFKQLLLERTTKPVKKTTVKGHSIMPSVVGLKMPRKETLAIVDVVIDKVNLPKRRPHVTFEMDADEEV
jgi:hypothetical protein